MQKIKDWSAHIVRHFWHCASSCRENEATSDEEALRVMKVSVSDVWCIKDGHNATQRVKILNSFTLHANKPYFIILLCLIPNFLLCLMPVIYSNTCQGRMLTLNLLTSLSAHVSN